MAEREEETIPVEVFEDGCSFVVRSADLRIAGGGETVAEAVSRFKRLVRDIVCRNVVCRLTDEGAGLTPDERLAGKLLASHVELGEPSECGVQ